MPTSKHLNNQTLSQSAFRRCDVLRQHNVTLYGSSTVALFGRQARPVRRQPDSRDTQKHACWAVRRGAWGDSIRTPARTFPLRVHDSPIFRLCKFLYIRYSRIPNNPTAGHRAASTAAAPVPFRRHSRTTTEQPEHCFRQKAPRPATGRKRPFIHPAASGQTNENFQDSASRSLKNFSPPKSSAVKRWTFAGYLTCYRSSAILHSCRRKR